jgi:hypothetical protein
MSAEADTDAPLPVEFDDPPDDVHPEAQDILAVVYGASATLEALYEALEAGRPPENLTQEKLEAFEAAFRVGERVLDHENYEVFLQEGRDALPDELVDEIDAKVAPVASCYGVEMDHATGGIAVADYLIPAAVSRWST